MRLPKQSPPVRRDYMPEIKMVVEEEVIYAKARKLKAVWSYVDLDLDYSGVRDYLRASQKSKADKEESIWDEIW